MYETHPRDWMKAQTPRPRPEAAREASVVSCTLVTLVTACPDPTARPIHHAAGPTLTISRVPCLTPA
jgi:hypothetical protein